MKLKMRALQRDKYIGGLELNKEKLTKRWCKFLRQQWSFLTDHCLFERVMGVETKVSNFRHFWRANNLVKF